MADPAPKKAKINWPMARRMLGYVRWYWIGLAVGLSLLIGLTTQAFPYLQYAAIDRYLAPRAGSEWALLPIEARLAGTATIAWLYLAVGGVAFAAQTGFELMVAWIGQRVLHRLRSDQFAKIQRLPIAYFDRNPVGQVVSRVVADVETVNTFLSSGFVTLAQSLFMLIACAAYMFFLSWRLALIAVVAVPIVFFVFRVFGLRLLQIQGRVRARMGAFISFLNEHIAGMSTLQLHNQQARARADVAQLNRGLLESQLSAFRWGIVMNPIVGFLTNVVLALTLWYGGGLTVQNLISLGTLVAFAQYLRNFFQPLYELTALPDAFPAALASAERIFGVLDQPETVSDDPETVAIDRLRGEVEFDDVWFAYQGEEWVLKGLRLSIRAGESVALVGSTGSGKTTLFSLLARFYDVGRGEVRVDGIPLRRFAQRDLRRRIGLVLQDAFLFSGTIESNLRMGNQELPLARLVEVCTLVGVHDFIQSLPQGYQTPVIERGATLSAGQKQLLSFARALVLDPQILLLDEATANVDSDSEQKIQDALRVLMRGRTSIVIAHRLSTVRHCDRVLVMSQGTIVEEGPAQQLVDAGGYYAKLHALQAADQAA